MQNTPEITTEQLNSSILLTSRQIIQYITTKLKGKLTFVPEMEYGQVYVNHLTTDKVIIEIRLYAEIENSNECSYKISISKVSNPTTLEMFIEFLHGTELFHLMPEKIISSLHLAADLNKEITIEI